MASWKINEHIKTSKCKEITYGTFKLTVTYHNKRPQSNCVENLDSDLKILIKKKKKYTDGTASKMYCNF